MAAAIPIFAIRQSYLWPDNAAMAAFKLRMTWGVKIGPTELKRRWEAELETNAMLRLLGERPEFGFRRDEKVELAEMLVA